MGLDGATAEGLGGLDEDYYRDSLPPLRLKH